MKKVCKNCNKEFNAKRADLMHCSMKCRIESSKQIISCERCKKKIITTKWHAAHGKKFCSNRCYNLAHYKKVKCAFCGKFKFVKIGVLNCGGGKYCNYKCFNSSLISCNSIKKFGIVFHNRKGGYYYNTTIKKLLHHVIWERYFKVKVPLGFVIHHIDHNVSNNSISNLKLMSSSEHASYHGKLLKHPKMKRDKNGKFICKL